MFHRIFTCAFCENKWTTVKFVFTFIRVLWILSIGALVPVYGQSGRCPSTDKLQDVSYACFNNFSAQKLNLENSGRRLFSGINIEILRAYCSAYIDGVTCIKQLLETCPSSALSDIKIGIKHLKGTEQELADLCRTQELYEIYSQHMGCFMDRGRKSEWCIDSKINSSAYLQPHEDFCTRVRGATQCVENNIRHGCGDKAAELVHKLVKPSIRNSGSCTYDVYSADTSDQPTDIKRSGSSPSNQKTGDQGKRDASHSSPNTAASISPSASNVVLIALAINISIVFCISNTFKFTRIS